MIKSLTYAIICCAAVLGSTANARENRPLKCNTGAARASGYIGGPALVANVPRAMTPIDLNGVMMTDKSVARQVIVEGLFARRTEMNTLEITARFVNCTKKPLSIQVRSNFMDKAQIPTEPVSVWKTIFLSPRSTSIYQEKSIGMASVDAFLVELRSSQ